MFIEQRMPVTLSIEGDVATISMDDGKMNAFGFDLCKDVTEAMDLALARGAGAVVVAGNAKAFSAGFDLQIMAKGTSDQQAALFEKGSELILKFFEFPRPLVIAAQGHGLALGAILLLAADVRIGSNAPKHKYGLNEVAIGMSVPVSGSDFIEPMDVD
jgi:enoyl-CoA hydratase